MKNKHKIKQGDGITNHKIQLTDKQVDFLRENIDRLTYKELAVRLKISICTVKNKCNEYGIRKNIDKARYATNYEYKLQDYMKYREKISIVKNKCRTGMIYRYKVLKMYDDKVLVVNDKGYKECFSYIDLALVYRGDK